VTAKDNAHVHNGKTAAGILSYEPDVGQIPEIWTILGQGSTKTSEVTTLSGEVSKLRYFDEERGFSVFDVIVSLPEDISGTTVTAVGPLPGVTGGMEVRLSGDFRNHPRFGVQFRFGSGMQVPPSSGRGIMAFLSSGAVEGVGKILARRLFDHFGEGLRLALDTGPEKLTSCPGIGSGRAAAIWKAWKKGIEAREAVIVLCDMGLLPAQASRIAGLWGASAPSIVASDPWSLQRHLRGYGFKSADRVASRIGTDPLAPARLKAAVAHALAGAQDSGHMFLREDVLLESASGLVDLTPRQVVPGLEALVSAGEVVREDRAGEGAVVYASGAHQAELGAAVGLAALCSGAPAPIPVVACPGESDLAPSQMEALRTLCSFPVSILTGGPGTGKTTVVGRLMTICRKSGIRVSLAAPTGRAAMRMREASGVEALTLHRLLEYNPATDRFVRGPDNPLEADWVVVDESSMIDMFMFHALVAAIRPGTRLTLVGDADQLPPVGPGDPFREAIRSGSVPVARLTQVFRQGDGSSIVSAAHEIMAGRVPSSDRSSGSDPGDFHVVFRESAEEAADLAVALVTERIPARFGLDPRQDIQVLAPMKKGSCGTDELNERIRRRLNPGVDDELAAQTPFLPGDRVMQTRNNYDLDVFNGDIGTVAGPSGDNGLLVRFDRRIVRIPAADMDDLCQAFAVTVHKSQGSEFPAVVVCMHNQHFVMLRRNLLYTAVTRGRRVVVLVGSRKAIGMAAGNTMEEGRNTLLASRLRECRQP